MTPHGTASSALTEQRSPGRWLVAGVCLTALAAAWPIMVTGAYYGGSPPAHTGGFGEATCHECHFENNFNDPDTGMRRGGFQLAARTLSGEQSGTLQPTDDRTEVALSDGVAYLRHTGDGTSAHRAEPTP